MQQILMGVQGSFTPSPPSPPQNMQNSMKQRASSEVTVDSPASIPFKWEAAPGKPLPVFSDHHHHHETLDDDVASGTRIPPPSPLRLPPKLEFQRTLHSRTAHNSPNLKNQSVTENRPGQNLGNSYYNSSCCKLDNFPHDDGYGYGDQDDAYEEKYAHSYEDVDGVYEDEDCSFLKLYVFSHGVFNQRFFFEKDSPRTFLAEKNCPNDLKHSESIDSWESEKESCKNNEKNNSRSDELDEDEYDVDTESSSCSSPWQPFIYHERTSISPTWQQSSTDRKEVKVFPQPCQKQSSKYERGGRASPQPCQQTSYSHIQFDEDEADSHGTERDGTQQHATDTLHTEQTRKKPPKLLGLDRASRAGSDAMDMFHERSSRQKSPSRISVETEASKGQESSMYMGDAVMANMLHEKPPLHLQHSRFCTNDAAVAHVEAAGTAFWKSSNELHDNTANDSSSWCQHSRFSKQNGAADVTYISCETSPCQKPSKVCETDADVATTTKSRLPKSVRRRAKPDAGIDVAILCKQSSRGCEMDSKNLDMSENASATDNSSCQKFPITSGRDDNANVAVSPASSANVFPKSCRTIRSIHHRRYESAPSLHGTEYQQSLCPEERNAEDNFLAFNVSDPSHDGESKWQPSVREQEEDNGKDKDQNFSRSKSHGSCVVGKPVSWQTSSVFASSSPWILAFSPDNSLIKSQERIVARVTLQSLLSKVWRGRKKSITEYSHGEMWSPTLATYLHNQREEEMFITRKHGEHHENLVCQDDHLTIKKKNYLRSYTDPAEKKHDNNDDCGDYDYYTSEKTKLSLQEYMRSEEHEKSKIRKKFNILVGAMKVLMHKQKPQKGHKHLTCLKINLNAQPSTRNSSSSTTSDQIY